MEGSAVFEPDDVGFHLGRGKEGGRQRGLMSHGAFSADFLLKDISAMCGMHVYIYHKSSFP